ncbi:MAG: hypothetical protein ACRDIY_10710 [Chloroflexota bacterium]
METRQKTIFRLRELAELRRQLAEPLSAGELARRQRVIERMKRFQESMPVIPGDVKDWIRPERGGIRASAGRIYRVSRLAFRRRAIARRSVSSQTESGVLGAR